VENTQKPLGNHVELPDEAGRIVAECDPGATERTFGSAMRGRYESVPDGTAEIARISHVAHPTRP
jgi:hypothetical protein